MRRCSLFWTVSDPDIGAFTATVFKTDGADEGAVESYVGRVMYPMEPQRKLSGREDRFFSQVASIHIIVQLASVRLSS